MSLPVGMPEGGVPVGVQVVGPYGDDGRLVRLARRPEEEPGWSERVPKVRAANGK